MCENHAVRIKIPDKDYQLTAHRHLEAGGTKIRLVAVFRSLTGPEKTVTAISHFEKMGPSPNSRPAPSRAPSAGPVGDSAADIPIGSESAVTPRRDLSGTWERTRAVNLESFLGGSNSNHLIASSGCFAHVLMITSTYRCSRRRLYAEEAGCHYCTHPHYIHGQLAPQCAHHGEGRPDVHRQHLHTRRWPARHNGGPTRARLSANLDNIFNFLVLLCVMIFGSIGNGI